MIKAFKDNLLKSTIFYISNNRLDYFNIKRILKCQQIERNLFYQYYSSKDAFALDILEHTFNLINFEINIGPIIIFNFSITKEIIINHGQFLINFINMMKIDYLKELIIYKYNLFTKLNKINNWLLTNIISHITFCLYRAIIEKNDLKMKLTYNKSLMLLNSY